MNKHGCRTRIFVFGSILNAVLWFYPQATIAQADQITSYRVSGWQADLVQGSPNLKNFYWEPLTKKRRILTTRHTGKQAESSPLPHRSIIYCKTPFALSKPAKLPSKPKLDLPESTARTSEASCVLTYKQAERAEVSNSALTVNAKLAQRSVDAQVMIKGLSAGQSCLSLTSRR
ncbi:hypothetical protein BH10CYA1_BH10CYA1_17880 [soil metagenome]